MHNSVKLYLIQTACLFLLTTNTYANYICSRTGAITECGEGKLNNLHVAGKATLIGTTILGDTHIAGVLNATNVNLNTLYVAGKARITSSQIRGIAKISGLLVSCKNKFAQKLTISSDKTYLEGTETGDIEINRGGDTQVLYLGNQTIVHGNITFPEKTGLVILDKTAKIDGHVIGGYLDKNNFQLKCGDQNEKD